MPVKNHQQSTGERLDLERAVGLRIRAMREARGLSQAQLGQRMADYGYPMEQPTVYKLEKGQRPIRLNELAALGAILDMQVHELLTADVDEEERRRALEDLVDATNQQGQAREAVFHIVQELDRAREQVARLQTQMAEAHHALDAATAARAAASARFNELQRKAGDRG